MTPISHVKETGFRKKHAFELEADGVGPKVLNPVVPILNLKLRVFLRYQILGLYTLTSSPSSSGGVAPSGHRADRLSEKPFGLPSPARPATSCIGGGRLATFAPLAVHPGRSFQRGLAAVLEFMQKGDHPMEAEGADFVGPCAPCRDALSVRLWLGSHLPLQRWLYSTCIIAPIVRVTVRQLTASRTLPSIDSVYPEPHNFTSITSSNCKRSITTENSSPPGTNSSRQRSP